MLQLYIWPGAWDLPSLCPLCISSATYLQLVIPGKFTLIECSNPDASPSGSLPFLIDTEQNVSLAGFDEIVAYVKASYGVALDDELTPLERAQSRAWSAYVERELGDLVGYAFFGNGRTWGDLTRGTLAHGMEVPLRWYVPGRVRDGWRRRLEGKGLWDGVEIELEEEGKGAAKKDWFKARDVTVRRTFAKERVCHASLSCSLRGLTKKKKNR